MDILENLRKVNCDYYQVGWYQSTYLSSHFTKDFFESQIPYQTKIEESVVLVYGESIYYGLSICISFYTLAVHSTYIIYGLSICISFYTLAVHNTYIIYGLSICISFYTLAVHNTYIIYGLSICISFYTLVGHNTLYMGYLYVSLSIHWLYIMHILYITGDLIPGSSGHTLLSSLSSNLFDAQSSIRTLLVIRNYT